MEESVEDAQARTEMMARCLAFATAQAGSFAERQYDAQALEQYALQASQAEEMQQKQAERERKKKEREAADAELVRIHHENMQIAEKKKAQDAYQMQNRDEINKLAEQTADDCVDLLERLQNRQQRSPSVQRVAAAPSGAPPAPADTLARRSKSKSIGTHQERMDARRRERNRSQRSRSRRRSYERERDPPRSGNGFQANRGDGPRVPRRLMYNNDAATSRRPFEETLASTTKHVHRSCSRSKSRQRSRSKPRRQRSRSRSDRRDRRDRGRRGRSERKRSRSKSKSRSSSRSKSGGREEEKRKAAIRDKMKQWEGKTLAHKWS